jgi:hypothetical protein
MDKCSSQFVLFSLTNLVKSVPNTTSILFCVKAFPSHGSSISPLSSKCKNPPLFMSCDLYMAWHSKKFFVYLEGTVYWWILLLEKKRVLTPTPWELGDNFCLFISVRSIWLGCKYLPTPTPCDLCILMNYKSKCV